MRIGWGESAVAFRIKNWSKFQHFKDRRPPWVKLHRELLDDRGFNALDPMSCKVLVMLWLIASESLEGHITSDVEQLSFRLRLPEAQVQAAVTDLLESGFLVDAESPEDAAAASTAKLKAEANGFGSRHISDATKRAVWERDGGKCVYCESSENIEYDHKHPVSKGGNSEPDNIQLLCRPCNRKKRTKTAEQLATPAQPWLSIRTTEAEGETEKETDSAEALSPAKKTKSKDPECPEDVNCQVWSDWLALRKKKSAPVTATTITGARQEAALAGMTLSRFLEIWCLRGSQGLQADWLTQKERGRAVQGVTVPAPANADAALQKIKADAAKATPPSLETLERMAQLRKSIPQGAQA